MTASDAALVFSATTLVLVVCLCFLVLVKLPKEAKRLGRMEFEIEDLSRHVCEYANARAKEQEDHQVELERRNAGEDELRRKNHELESKLANRPEVGIKFFEETRQIDGIFRKRHEVRYLMQLTLGERHLPIGHPCVIKTDVVRQVDHEIINKVLDDFAKPLMNSGFKVLNEANDARLLSSG